MQWSFLILALLAALIELNTGTFYLAAVAVAAVLTSVIGVWVRDDLLIVVFLVLCASLLAAVALWRRTSNRRAALPDFDVGQSVSVQRILPHDNHLLVSYRGTNWEAVMDDGTALAPGATATIAGKTDKLLHLVSSPAASSPTVPSAGAART
jgi:membrane protein implicated in regulation of membrane protease activity